MPVIAATQIQGRLTWALHFSNTVFRSQARFFRRKIRFARVLADNRNGIRAPNPAWKALRKSGFRGYYFARHTFKVCGEHFRYGPLRFSAQAAKPDSLTATRRFAASGQWFRES